ncbi:transcriptional regulator GcvA [Bradyrhizobium sp. NP1]|uniref:transcriptional regulator GcvA n=1 Tax=Bradyrhizobium sp. NP1 TaxID=3049772 RepID=UPI0025A4D7C9|nr:transcriptional regulator GcvA [Bradyrhizobium sp. NP1]WJR78654.1 transcriptional regulator GcvA [Bradyrhizobium sp. NP1]
MKKQRLPPLNALRAFEATAKHLSVKKAAEELYVSAGAVSQMLKALELHLGVTLFKRVNRGILLTDAGAEYLPAIRNAFRQIAEATSSLATASGAGTLKISTTAAFASSWLVPRLKHFQEQYPEIDLQVQTGQALADFARGGVDLAVRHGLGRYPNLRSERLFAIEVVPVASPELVAELGLPAEPSALARWPHVHDAGRRDWQLWLEAQGVPMTGPPRGPAFDDSGLLLAAVRDGQGAGLLPAAIVAQDLARGRLVKLAEIVWPEAFAYYLVYPESNGELPKVAAFRSWILDVATDENLAA